MIFDELKSVVNNLFYLDVICCILVIISKMDLVNLFVGELDIEGSEIYFNYIIVLLKLLYE